MHNILPSICATCFFVANNVAAFPRPLWLQTRWSIFFLSMNIFQLSKLWLEARPVRFADEERQVFEGMFKPSGVCGGCRPGVTTI